MHSMYSLRVCIVIYQYSNNQSSYSNSNSHANVSAAELDEREKRDHTEKDDGYDEVVYVVGNVPLELQRVFKARVVELQILNVAVVKLRPASRETHT